jgi:hypothetical protein
MEKVQKNSVNSVQHTPSSESFQANIQGVRLEVPMVGSIKFTVLRDVIGETDISEKPAASIFRAEE